MSVTEDHDSAGAADPQSLRLHPDRLFPAEPGTRQVARSIYQQVADDPIYSPHGHVPASLLADNQPFSDPAELFVTPDHYVTRLLHAHGITLDRLGVNTSDADPRDIWRLLCSHWHVFAGTVVRYWLENELQHVFGIDLQPSADTADTLYDQLTGQLTRPEFRPRALFDRFNIAVLATTDDPADTLAAHDQLANDPTFGGAVIPTFRADRYMTPSDPNWSTALDQLAAASNTECNSYTGMLAALRNRRQHFINHGATATDTGVPDAIAEPLTDTEAERLHQAGRNHTITTAEATAYRRNMTYRLAEMSADDGLVMQLHPDIIRNHHHPTWQRFGPETGHDLPGIGSFTTPLRRVLNDFGTDPNFRLVLFTTDETTYSREIAPLAGFYPSVYVGAPWWFLDTPTAITRFRAAATDSAGFTKTSGFIDDTRAFCSIPARHDMSRRIDAGYLANLVTTHQLDETEAHSIATNLAGRIPVNTFRLHQYTS